MKCRIHELMARRCCFGKALVLSSVLLFSAACQTTNGGAKTVINQAFIDSYDFSSSTKEYLREYEKKVTMRVMAIAKTKGSLSYRYFHGTVFRRFSIVNNALKGCRESYGEECVILAYENVLAPEGVAVLDQVYSGVGNTVRKYLSESDKNLCNFAITGSRPASWDERPNWADAVT